MHLSLSQLIFFKHVTYFLSHKNGGFEIYEKRGDIDEYDYLDQVVFLLSCFVNLAMPSSIHFFSWLFF